MRLVLLAAAVSGCSFEGDAGPACPDEAAACGETCVDTATDPANCGACGTSCAAGAICGEGRCLDACTAALDDPIVDAWGTAWDGAPRVGVPLASAASVCTAIGGRLPTVAELFRARATGSSSLASPPDSRLLWSTAPNDATEQVAMRLSDGFALDFPITAPLDYRCVCPAPAAAGFTGARCHGPATAPCFGLGRLAIDREDRPALRLSAALAECAHVDAQLADLPTLVEAAQAGLPGSGAYLHTADRASYTATSTIAWTTPQWTTAQLASLDTSTPAPFRCAGWSAPTGGHPNPLVDAFAGANGPSADATDRAAGPWSAAHATCVAAGGHLARATELATLVAVGLPRGSGQPLWTSDQTGYGGAGEFLAASESWLGVDLRAPSTYPQISWVYKWDAGHAARCIYYPIDPAIVAPTTCTGACFAVTLPGASPARMWFDPVDRPAAPFDRAIDECRGLGGHLASERDLLEAIRAGLPNGSGAYLLTSDLGQGYISVVRFVGVEPAFDDLFSTGHMTWVAPSTAAPFRCTWTNELR